MSIDPALAALSDQLLTATIVAYTLAMLGYAVEYAFGRRGAVARVADRPAVRGRELVGVGARTDDKPVYIPPPGVGEGIYVGGDTDDQFGDDDLGDDAPPASPPAMAPGRAVLAGRLAVLLTVLGALAHVACLVTRGFAADRVPWGNMYEFVIAVCLVGIVAWLAVVAARPVRHLGLFVMLAVVLLLGIAGLKLYTQAAPLVPALNSYWIKIHVSAAALSAGTLLVGFVTAVLFLIRDRYDARVATGRQLSFPTTLGPRLPTAEWLERLTFRLHALAFPIWTAAIIMGAIWAEAAWGRPWGWDPKETWSFVSWVVYAAYLHARATAGYRRGPVSAWIAVAGWITMMINLFGVNLVISGLHSYAGI